jgi:phage terminase large subunit
MMKNRKSNEQYKKFVDKYRKNPAGFIHEILGVKHLTSEQKAIVKSVWANKYTGVKAAHSVGKTFIEACIVLTYINLYSNAIVITTAPTARQVKDLLWAEINRLFAKCEYDLLGDMKMMSYTIGPKWFAAGIATEAGKEEQSAVKFQGYHSGRILVVLDEAVGIHPSIWEAVDGIASSEKSKVLALGNPATINCSFKKHLESKSWNCMNISALNHINVKEKKEIINGAVSYEWVTDKIEKWCTEVPEPETPLNKPPEFIFCFNNKFYKPNSLFLWKVLGEFPEESIDTLIPLYKIRQAMARGKVINENKHTDSFCHLSLDVARFGSDYSVFAVNKNNHFITKPFYHLDSAKLAGEAINLIKIHKPSKVAVDCDGVGAGVYDILNENKNEGIIDVELYEIHGGSNPLPLGQTEDFLNLRAQMYWMFKNEIDSVSIEDNEEIGRGFSSIKYYFNSKGKTQIESKEEIKKRLGRSTDPEDAVVYCNFLKYTDSANSGTFEYSDENERFETVTEKIGI